MDNKNPQDKRPDKQKRSVLMSDHPVFSRIKAELTSRNRQRSAVGGPTWQERLQAWDLKFDLRSKAVIAAIAIFLSFFIYREITDPYLDYREGQVAQRHLIAQSTIEFVDEPTTNEKRLTAVNSILPVYDYDHRVILKSIQNLRTAFRTMRTRFPNLLRRGSEEFRAISTPGSERSDLFQNAKRALSQALEVEISDEEFRAFVQLQFSPKLERTLVHLFAPVELKLIVLSREMLSMGGDAGISVNHVNEPFVDPREEVFKDLASIIDLKVARENFIKNGKEIFLSSRTAEEIRVLTAVSNLVVPNLVYNRSETEKRKAGAADELQPVIIKINKGESIVRYGDTITKRHLTVLRYLEKSRAEDSSYLRFFFTAVLLTVLLYSIYLSTRGGFDPFVYTARDVFVFSLLGVSGILAIKGVQFIAIQALLEKFPQIPLDFYYFLVPVAAGPAIIQMITARQPAIAFTIVMAVVGGILLERNFFYACYVMSASLVAILLSSRIKTRAVIYRMGLGVGLINVILITSIVANTRSGASLNLLWQDMGWIFWSGFLSGMLTSAVVVSFVPVIEWLFGHTTDLRLLELSAMNHPLLKDLMVKAPGTYHHSIIIGSLVEKAAEAIGANPLMARVMAYYHDVGKMERPLYFIENQGGGYNRHDALQPHMSAMIIREHVKKGQELGYKFKLPQPIIDAMSEHHGSSKITYFYNKARSLAEDPDAVLESDYQYDGRNPQSKETALIMLGDVVEAATRSLADPTPLRLSNVVRNVLNKYFAEGHLSECNLTLRDLDLIAESFLDVLIGIYHARIDYGISVTKDAGYKKKTNGTADTKSGSRKTGAPATPESSNVKSIAEAVRPAGTRGSGDKKS